MVRLSGYTYTGGSAALSPLATRETHSPTPQGRHAPGGAKPERGREDMAHMGEEKTCTILLSAILSSHSETAVETSEVGAAGYSTYNARFTQ
jgi:hypothetical protein